MKVPVGISARHIHVTEEHFKILFGSEANLHNKKDLKQPGQFASEETVSIASEKGKIDRVRVLGPLRSYTQVELSKTDAIKLGLTPPVRDSGKLEGSAPITIIGPKGTLPLKQGCILATRHIHISAKEAQNLGLIEEHPIKVKVNSEKGGILDNVHIKITQEAYFEIHLDTDDANAFLLNQNDEVEILNEIK